MKAKVVVMLLAVMLPLLVINPVPSYAGGHGYYSGWAVGGAFVGGAVLGTALGSALAGPRSIRTCAPAGSSVSGAGLRGVLCIPRPSIWLCPSGAVGSCSRQVGIWQVGAPSWGLVPVNPWRKPLTRNRLRSCIMLRCQPVKTSQQRKNLTSAR